MRAPNAVNVNGSFFLPALHGARSSSILNADLFTLLRLPRCPPALHYSQRSIRGSPSLHGPFTPPFHRAHILLAHIQRAQCTCVFPRSLTVLNINVGIISEAPKELRNAALQSLVRCVFFPVARRLSKSIWY